MTPARAVLFAADTLLPPAGGAEWAALELLDHLAGRGHHVRALSYPIEVLGVRPGRSPSRGAWQWRELAQSPGPLVWAWVSRLQRGRELGQAVAQELERRPADVVITQLSSAPWAVAAAHRHGASAALTLCGYEALCHYRYELDSECSARRWCHDCPRHLNLSDTEREARRSFIEAHRRSLVEADLLVAVSHSLAAEVRAACGRRPEIVAPASTPPGAAPADRHGPLLAVSSFWTPEKGGRFLATLAERIAPRRLIVQAGDEGRVCPLGPLPPNVELRTAPATIDELLPGCSLLVVPSQFPDPWPRVAFEGMAAGMPVLASDIGGLQEFVPPPLRVSPPHDAGAWARAIDRVLGTAARWEDARAAGRAAAATLLERRPRDRLAELVEGLARRPAVAPRAGALR